VILITLYSLDKGKESAYGTVVYPPIQLNKSVVLSRIKIFYPKIL